MTEKVVRSLKSEMFLLLSSASEARAAQPTPLPSGAAEAQPRGPGTHTPDTHTPGPPRLSACHLQVPLASEQGKLHTFSPVIQSRWNSCLYWLSFLLKPKEEPHHLKSFYRPRALERHPQDYWRQPTPAALRQHLHFTSYNKALYTHWNVFSDQYKLISASQITSLLTLHVSDRWKQIL